MNKTLNFLVTVIIIMLSLRAHAKKTAEDCECEGLGYFSLSWSVAILVCSFHSHACKTQKSQQYLTRNGSEQTIIKFCVLSFGLESKLYGQFFPWITTPNFIYSTLLSLRLIVELSSSPSTPLAQSLAKMIAISCIPSAASCTQRDCLGWPRQMIMNKSELWLITTR